ncbi:nitrate- and nitrite sensing domain-containing protein [Dactylosporangium aurantiacum]|uniref:histidine kinase n=1 Tax=Dactylosporangium aurantiacum TaxID=35754 RepID=A0A9Q9IIZ8_9ACTN|nr:nitrate- and nitrite sensing domain-containing protein [Dactylosporangium aurantiacum]MDG6100921.1 nitrate- and nitrite sensing domain-containing protein [Dactylosporangium aurantiacum]UWZ55025.1 nitrate- and nitrite sensing domain-containing protein [Dactylosporangium aurantiacum]
MLLDRFRIRGKLTLLVALPLLAMFGLFVPVAVDLVSTANRAAETDAAVALAERVGPLVEDLQQERLLSIGYLIGAVDPTDLARQSARVSDQLTAVIAAGELPDELADSLEMIRQQLPTVRERVLIRAATPDDALDRFVPLLDETIEALGLVDFADGTTATGRALLTLDALLRANESLTESTAILAVMSYEDPTALLVRYREEQAEREVYEEQFAAFATPAQSQLYALVSTAFEERLGTKFNDDFDADPVAAMRARPLAALFPELRSFSVLGGFVEKRLIDDLSSAVSRQERQALTTAYGAGGLTALVLLVVLLLVASVVRAVAAPLIRLTRSAERIAEAGEEELRRVADDEVDVDATTPVRLDVLDAGGSDEIGDLARAFDRVQVTAAQLVERQVVSRRNVAEMFGHIGRRTQNLVSRQLGIIDQLETQETDGARLEQLYGLDHLSNRLRRSADSLVVISGSGQAGDHVTPVRLIDIARLALAQIEEYTRVDTDIPIELLIAPGVVGDLVLLAAELLENATNFSPPHTRVTIAARATIGGVRIVVVDNGIGMSDERLAEENARLVRRERLDLVPSRVLGLFVAGRLARRHGFRVALAHTPEGGVTATVDLGPSHVVAGAAPVTVPSLLDGPTRELAAPRAAALLGDAGGPLLPVRRLQEATEAMRDWRPWNAFAAGSRALPTSDVPLSAVAPSPAGAAAVSPSGLRRRVPGQQLPTGPQRVVPEAPPTPADALAARDMIEQFEAGVRRADEHTVNGSTAGAPAVPTQPTPTGSGPRPLRRRTPGAALPAMDRPARPPAADATVHDPDTVRNLVEQFETGVARALRDAPTGTDTPEGFPR